MLWLKEEVLNVCSCVYFQTQHMLEMKMRLEELQMENEYQLRLKDMNYNEKLRELSDNFVQQIESLKTSQQVCLCYTRAQLHIDLQLKGQNVFPRLAIISGWLLMLINWVSSCCPWWIRYPAFTAGHEDRDGKAGMWESAEFCRAYYEAFERTEGFR